MSVQPCAVINVFLAVLASPSSLAVALVVVDHVLAADAVAALALAVVHVHVAVLASPAGLALALVVVHQVQTAVGVHARRAEALVLVCEGRGKGRGWR